MGNNSTNITSKLAGSGPKGMGFVTMSLLLVVVMTVLLGKCYLPDHNQFSNDGPLGRLMSECHQLPGAFTGVWEDLNSIGFREQGALPNISCGLRYLLGPVLFSKFYASVALLILGLSGWCFFRQAKLVPTACILGGFAAALNSDFFSTACWGVASHPLAVAMCFLALASLMNATSWKAWVRVALAGLAVGMGMAEGADVGAILSLYVAAFVVYQAWITDGSRAKNLTFGAGRLALVAIFAAFLAAQAISALVNTQIEGVMGMSQDTKTKEERWNWATQWSLPKSETLSLVVPGLFGYRIDSIGGGNYWGAIGRDIAWDQYLADSQRGETRPRTLLRQTGGGIYAGVTVVLVAFWAALQSFRRVDSIFNATQKKWIWFWIGVIAVSLPLAYGRHAPFYGVIYRLPYFSTIRNPVKFLTLVNLALVIIFAYGVDGLWRRCAFVARPGAPRVSKATIQFDNWWIIGCVTILAVSLVAWAVYANSRVALEAYLQSVMYSDTLSRSIAEFSINQVGWFVIFFVVAAGLVAMMLKGSFVGARATLGVAFLGLVLLLDLGRANQQWIIDWDYVYKYASNPVIDLLRHNPYEGRVALEPFQGHGNKIMLDQLYHYEWAQQQFQYYDIQSVDVVQLPRVPQDLEAYSKALRFDGSMATMPLILRRWELTNTRYLMGSAEYVDDLNTRFDPVKKRFRILQRFNVVSKNDVSSPRRLERLTAQPTPQGDYAVFEFTGDLPRARLYANWQVNTNGAEALAKVIDPSFDPTSCVVVSGGLPQGATPSETNQNPGTVDFVNYTSKDIKLNAKTTASSVLLYNDRFDPNWKVLVDGKPATVLRCNFIMRGVYLEPGNHNVEFQFKPPTGALYVSVAAIGIGLILIGVVAVGKSSQSDAKPAAVANPVSSASPVKQEATPKPISDVKPETADKKKAGKQKSRR